LSEAFGQPQDVQLSNTKNLSTTTNNTWYLLYILCKFDF